MKSLFLYHWAVRRYFSDSLLEEHVIPLYAQMQQAEAEGEWVQVLTLATEIELLLPGYKDVAASKAEASRQLQTPKTFLESRAAAVEVPIVETDPAPEIPAQPEVVVPQKRVSTAKADLPAKKQGNPTYMWLVGGFVGVIIIGFLIWRVTAGSQSPETPDLSIRPANPVLGSSWVRPVDEMVMVYVPGGSFMMGSDPDVDSDAWDDEQPQHEVTLDGFWIDQTEVTNAQYTGCVGVGNCESADSTGDDNQPVVRVSWHDAKAYCEWTGGNLPTEAQWEYAARGDDGRIYPWGNETVNCELANYRDCIGSTSLVGSYADGTSWVGAMDMAGNVWEWTNDWYAEDYYVKEIKANPTGPSTGDRKVLRGGGWFSNAQVVCAALRFDDLPPTARYVSYGFRCASPGK